MSYNISNSSNSGYPTMSQSDWDNAPFSEPIDEFEEVKATVSITLSKTIKVEMNVKDKEEGYYSNCVLEKAANKQLNLSNINVNEWCIDNFVVVEE